MSEAVIDLTATPPPADKVVEESIPPQPAGAGTGGDSFRLRGEQGDAKNENKEEIVESPPTLKSGQSAKGGQLGSAFTSLRKSLTLRRPLSKHHKAGRVASAERARSFDEDSGRRHHESSMESAEQPAGQSFTRNMTSAFHAVWRSGNKKKPAVESAPMSSKPTIRAQEPNKFFIENYNDMGDKVVEFGEEHDVSMRHAVMIMNCSNCTIKVTKKVNKIELAKCKKVNLIFPAVIASCDVQKSQSCKVTAMQNLPGMAIDTVESLQVYVPKSCKETIEITSSGSGSASLFIPKAEDSSDFDEFQIPFQFVHNIKNGKLVSTVSPLYTSG